MFSATERNSTRANLWKHLFPFAWCLLGGLLVLLAGTLPVSAHAVARYTLASVFDGIMQEGETIHVLAGKTCYVLTPEGRLEPCPYDCAKKPAEAWANIPSFLMITPEKHTYGLTINGELFLWTPGAETPWKYITTYEDIGSKHNGENPEYHELDIAYHADESTIYEQVFDRKTVSMEINCYDIATGEWKHLYTTENYDYSPGAIHPDGGLVTVGHSYGKTLLLRYTKNGKCETIVETEPFSQHIYGLVSDDSDGWYIITDNSLYHLSADGETTLVNTFTRMLFEWYAPTYYLPANQSVGFRSGNLFMLYTSPCTWRSGKR